MKKFLLLFLVSVTSMSLALAQGRTVTGTITDGETGEGIPGANVVIKGTSNGTITDFNGDYSINVSGDDVTLVVSYVGYATSEVAVGSRSVVDVQLGLDVQSLEEIVVVGYGTQEKKEITSAVASVKEEEFNKGTVNDPAQLIAGKVPGLTVSRPGGDPNGGFNIRLRGVSTVGANAEPLVVIDGVIGGSLSTVDPNDIASIDVLKDGSAAAIYGTRGSSGVILVTTKSGKEGKVQVDYNASVAAEVLANEMNFMDAAQYRAVDGANDLGSETDWLDLVTQTGVTQVHNLSMSGGTSTTSYRASINLRDAEGVGLNTGFTQLNARLNLSQKAFDDKLTLTTQIAATTKNAQFGNPEAFRYAVVANPTMPVYADQSGNGITAQGGYAERDIFDFFNPLSIAEQGINEGRDTRILASIRGDYYILDNLKVGVFYSQQRENDLRGEYYGKELRWRGANRNGIALRRTDERFNQLFETTVNYDASLGSKTDFAFLGGYSYQEFIDEGFGMFGGNFLTDAFTYNNMGAALDFANGLGSVLSYKNTSKLVAFFGRANFNIDGTYFISASARYEGSTRFGEDNKWGLFPAVSAGVTLSNLFDISGVDNLKFRASYGRTGNIPADPYQSLQRFGPTGNFFQNGAYGPSFGPVSNPNPLLSWETKDEINVGLDFALLESRLTGSFDWYTRTTSDLLLTVNVPVPPNLFNQTLVNVGELENTGMELALNYAAVNNSNFSWTPGINLATFRTTVNQLGNPDQGLTFGNGGVNFRASMGAPGQSNVLLSRVAEGEELGQLWGPVVNGVNDDGTLDYADLDGDGSYCACDADRQVNGNGLPDLTIGVNNNFTFGNWDLNFFLRGAFGHDLFNSYRGFYENTEITTVGNYNVVNTENFDPNVKVAGAHDRFVEDASFIRLDNATLGYNVSLDPGAAFRKLRVFISGQNLFTITGYTGVDPEVRYEDTIDGDNGGNVGLFPDQADPLAPGIERRSTYFTTTILTFGVNLGF